MFACSYIITITIVIGFLYLSPVMRPYEIAINKDLKV